MKILSPLIALVVFISLQSCNPESNDSCGFIKGIVNGVEMRFSAVPEDTAFNFNYRTERGVFIRFFQDMVTENYWGINIYLGDSASYLDDAKFPLVIRGPRPDNGSVQFYTNIVEPKGGPAGRYVASASTLENFEVEILSYENHIIKGRFKGTGRGEFSKGEFCAALKMK